jgi:D-alanine-D-alanine ligase
MTASKTGGDARVSVVLGGLGGERDVSLRTGRAIHGALLRRGYEAVLVEWPGDGFGAMMRSEPHTVFVALHGAPGEDGTLQGALEMAGHRFTGSGVRASAVSMDKALSKTIARSEGVPTPRWETRARGDLRPSSLPLPVVVKPSRDGSSVGLSFVDDGATWPEALRRAWEGRGPALVEERVFGKEVTVALMDEVVLGTVEIRPAAGVYDYDAKYVRGDTQYVCPADVADATLRQMERDAVRVARAIGTRGLVRVDFLVDAEQTAWFLEINTVPGMTERSLAPRIAQSHGWSFDELVERMVRAATLDGEAEG